MLKVTNIKFEQKKYTTKIPYVFSENPYLARIWLRTELFEKYNVTYDVETITNLYYFHTDCERIEQPWRLDLLDQKFDNMLTADVELTYPDQMAFYPIDFDLKAHTDSNGNIDYDLVAYEYLRNYLPVVFFYQELT